MADADLRKERHSLFKQILSTHFGIRRLYTTEYYVGIWWTPPFDVATLRARRWGRKQWADGNLQYGMMVIIICKLPSACRFLPHRLAAKVVTSKLNGGVQQMQTCYFDVYKSQAPECVLNIWMNSEYHSVLRSAPVMLSVGYYGCW